MTAEGREKFPKRERVTRIELAQPAWKAGALPLSYTRVKRPHATGRLDVGWHQEAAKAAGTWRRQRIDETDGINESGKREK